MTGSPTIRPADPDAIEAATAVLREGGLVAFPTETVYGLGADATNERAVAAIFLAKDRPRFNPLIAHYATADGPGRDVVLDGRARRLAAAFWPGPLTLVLPRRADTRLAELASAGLASAAVRVPAHPVARALIAAAGVPLAAPSANRSGEPSPTLAEHVAASLGERVGLILDGGACAVGLESTVVDLTGPFPAILRHGAVTAEDVAALVGPLVHAEDDAGRPKSPGRLARHYAPRTRLRLDARDVAAGEALLAFGPDGLPGAAVTMNLSPAADLTEAAANLFAMLRALDASGCAGIAVMPIPGHGIGRAINERLRRAAEG
ncbi:MAG: threonylcarbamoyl-AMP synthase [Alphaproteobacteria bacterium]|nr:threonylcarbamoyl-AMP synthase [Alphaproteobacteria bacterium]